MKKSILVLGLILSISIESKAQLQSQFIVATGYNTTKQVSLSATHYSGPEKDYDFYLRRSKNYRNVGWATLIGGVVLSGVGILLATGDTYGASTTPVVFLIAGAASGIVSIPFMIMASVTGHKAKLMLTNQKTGFGVPPHVSKDITGITFQIPFGK